MLRGAFIGFGNVAALGHLPGWQSQDDIGIVAATDPVAERSAAFLKACPSGRWYGSIDDLLSRESLDFVDICTPPSSHASLITRALGAGLHVLCEKPLVTRTEDLQIIVAAATRTGRIVHTVHNWLQAPICRKISSLIDHGEIGPIRSVRWQTLRTQPAAAIAVDGDRNWRLDPAIAGGGIFVDHGWHALYCITRWAGAPRGLTALLESRRFRESPIEDTATITLDLESGSGHIYLTWCANERANRIQIDGDHGRINVVDDNVILRSNSGERQWSCPPSLSEGSHHCDWFVGVTEEFRIAAMGGAKGNLDQAEMCAQLIDLAQRSSAAGGVHLPFGG